MACYFAFLCITCLFYYEGVCSSVWQHSLQPLSIAPVAIIVDITVSKTRAYRWTVWVGWALTVLGYGVFCLLDGAIAVVGIVPRYSSFSLRA